MRTLLRKPQDATAIHAPAGGGFRACAAPFPSTRFAQAIPPAARLIRSLWHLFNHHDIFTNNVAASALPGCGEAWPQLTASGGIAMNRSASRAALLQIGMAAAISLALAGGAYGGTDTGASGFNGCMAKNTKAACDLSEAECRQFLSWVGQARARKECWEAQRPEAKTQPVQQPAATVPAETRPQAPVQASLLPATNVPPPPAAAAKPSQGSTPPPAAAANVPPQPAGAAKASQDATPPPAAPVQASRPRTAGTDAGYRSGRARRVRGAAVPFPIVEEWFWGCDRRLRSCRD